MLELLGIRFLIFIAVYITLSVFVFLLLRVHDWLLGTTFRESFSIIKSEPSALAKYYSVRMFSVYLSVVVVLVVCILF